MGPWPEDLTSAGSWILGLTSLLLSICSIGGGSSGVKETGVSLLTGIQGGSVLFHVNRTPEAELQEMAWGFGPESDYKVMLRLYHGAEDDPTWVSLQDKYAHRVHVPNMTFLRIENLSLEDSGRYLARGSLPEGREFVQAFQLTVYEPVPLPQILKTSLSITSGWCNVTLECRTSADKEDLNITWDIKDHLRDLDGRIQVGAVPNSLVLAVSLPLNQPNAHLICLVSNLVDQKTATRSLGEVCLHEPSSDPPLGAILGTLAVVLVILGAGLYFWKKYGKKKKKLETGRGAELQEVHKDHDDNIDYVELNEKASQERQDKDISEHCLEEREALTTVYSEVHTPSRAMKRI